MSYITRNRNTFSSKRYDSGMSNDQIMAIAPSVFAESPHESRGDRYSFIPTSAVLEGMRAQGFLPVFAAQSNSRVEGKREFTRHMLRFRIPGHKALEVGDAVPEIVLLNSHDGSSSYQINAGLYRLICSNGMMVSGGHFEEIRVRHTNQIVDEVIQGSFNITGDLPMIADSVKEMSNMKLSKSAQIQFAKSAGTLRWGSEEKIPMSPESLLLPRRSADEGDALWHVFNRVQENLVKGGIRARTSNGRRTSTRGIGSVNADVRINRDLWALAANIVAMNRE